MTVYKACKKQAQVSEIRSAKAEDGKQLQAGSKSDNAKERSGSTARGPAQNVSKSHLRNEAKARTAATR